MQSDGLIGGKFPIHSGDPDHQQGRTAPMQRITGPGIQREGPLGLQSMGQPTAPVAQRFRMGVKHRAAALPMLHVRC